MEEVLNLINICPTNPIQILNQHDFSRFCVCPLNDTLKKILMLVLGLHRKDRKSTKDKANISNPKVNKGWPPLTANRTSADCVQISLGPSIQYIPLRVYRAGGFNVSTSLDHAFRIKLVKSKSAKYYKISIIMTFNVQHMFF